MCVFKQQLKQNVRSDNRFGYGDEDCRRNQVRKTNNFVNSILTLKVFVIGKMRKDRQNKRRKRTSSQRCNNILRSVRSVGVWDYVIASSSGVLLNFEFVVATILALVEKESLVEKTNVEKGMVTRRIWTLIPGTRIQRRKATEENVTHGKKMKWPANVFDMPTED